VIIANEKGRNCKLEKDRAGLVKRAIREFETEEGLKNCREVKIGFRTFEETSR